MLSFARSQQPTGHRAVYALLNVLNEFAFDVIVLGDGKCSTHHIHYFFGELASIWLSMLRPLDPLILPQLDFRRELAALFGGR